MTVIAFARIVLVCVFVVSAVAKLLDRPGTRRAVQDFGLPRVLAAPLATALPLLELLSAGLLLGRPAASFSGAALAAGMLLVFTAAITFHLVRGSSVECHCFGALSDKPLGWSSVVRNVALLALAALVLLVPAADRGTDAVTWAAERSAQELAVGAVLAGLVASVTVLGRLLAMLIRKYGQVLLRLERLEGAEPALPLIAIRQAPAFRLPTVAGYERSLADLLAASPTGHVALLFMAADCRPCSAVAAELPGWQSAHGDQLGLAVLGVGETGALATKFEDAPFPVLVGNGRAEHDAYGVDGTPAAVIVANGMVVAGPAYGADDVRTLVSRAATTLRAGGRVLEPPPAPAPGIGDAAPDAEVLLPDGTPTSLLMVVPPAGGALIFWDTTCGFCDDLLPQLVGLEGDFPAAALMVVRNPVGTHIGVELPTVFDPSAAVGKLYGSPGTPSAVLIDSDRRIASTVAVGGPAVLDLLRTSVVSPL